MTLSEIYASPDFQAMNPQDRVDVLNGFFRSGEAEREGLSGKDQIFLTETERLNGEFNAETPFKQEFIGQKLYYLDQFREQSDKATSPEELDTARRNYISSLQNVDKKLIEQIDNEDVITRASRNFVSLDPAQQNLIADESVAAGETSRFSRFGSRVLEGVRSMGEQLLLQQQYELTRLMVTPEEEEYLQFFQDRNATNAEIAQDYFEEMRSRIGGSVTDRQTNRASQNLDQGESIPSPALSILAEARREERESEKRVSISRLGEINLSPQAFVDTTPDELGAEAEALGAAPAAINRMKAHYADAKSGYLQQVRENVQKATENGVSLLGADAFLNPENYKVDTDEDVENIIRDQQNQNWLSKVISGGALKAEASFKNFLSGSLAVGVQLSGDEDLARGIATVREEAQAPVDEFISLMQASGSAELGQNVVGVIPDLLFSRGGASLVRGASREGAEALARVGVARSGMLPQLRGLSREALDDAAKFGAVAASGYTSGVNTYLDALNQGASGDSAMRYGILASLITSGVTGLGVNSGIEPLLTGASREQAQRGLMSFLGKVVMGTGKEGLEEFSDTILNETIIMSQLNPDWTFGEAVNAAWESAKVGAVLGSVGGTVEATQANLSQRAVPISSPADSPNAPVHLLGDEALERTANQTVRGSVNLEELSGLSESDRRRIELEQKDIDGNISSDEVIELGNLEEQNTLPLQNVEPQNGTEPISEEPVEASSDRNIVPEGEPLGETAPAVDSDGNIVPEGELSGEATPTVDSNRNIVPEGEPLGETAPATDSDSSASELSPVTEDTSGDLEAPAQRSTIEDDTNRVEQPTGEPDVAEAPSEVAPSPRRPISESDTETVTEPDIPEVESSENLDSTDDEPDSENDTETDTEDDTPEGRKPFHVRTGADIAFIENAVASVAGGKNTAAYQAGYDAVIDASTSGKPFTKAMVKTIAQRGISASLKGQRSGGEARRTGNVATLDTGVSETLIDESPSPSEAAESRDRVAEIMAFADTLPPTERAVFDLQVRGMTNAEMAAELSAQGNEVSANAVGQRVSRVRKKLADYLDQQTPDYVGANQPVQVVKDKKGRSKVEKAPTPPKTVSNAQRVNDLKAFLALDPEGRWNTQLGNIKPSTTRSKAMQAAVAVGRFFNRQVVPVSGLPQNGLFLPQYPDVIFISDTANRAQTLVAFHELLHSYAATNPEGYKAFSDAVDADVEAYIKRFPERNTGDATINKEEFLADFLADRASDPAFWDKLRGKNRSMFESLANLLRSMVKTLTKGRIGTEQFIRDMKKANAAALQALVDMQMQDLAGIASPQEGSGRIRQENPVGVQTSGVMDVYNELKPADFNKAEKVIHDQFFAWDTNPTGKEGVKTAKEFLANLQSSDFILKMQNALRDAGFGSHEVVIATGLGQAAYYGYVSRVYDRYPRTAESMVKLGMLARPNLQTIFANNSIGASELGRALRAFRQIPGGTITPLFDLEFQGREDAVAKQQGAGVAQSIKQTGQTDLVGDESLNAAEDAVLQSTKEGREHLRIEASARLAFRKAGAVLTAASKMFSNLFRAENPLDRYNRLATDENTPLERLEAAFNEALQFTLGQVPQDVRQQIEADLEVMDNQGERPSAGRLTRDRERLTGTTRTSNQVDILGKKFIGRVNYAPKEDADSEAKKERRESFQKLINRKNLTRAEFTEAYIELGGTDAMANEVFDAKLTHNRRQDEKAAENEARKAKEAAERTSSQSEAQALRAAAKEESADKKLREQNLKFIGKIGTDFESPRPTSQNLTYQQLVKQQSQLSNAPMPQADFEARLREFTLRDGRTPRFTEEEVQMISASTFAAREALQQARAESLSKKDSQKRAEDAAKAEVRRLETERREAARSERDSQRRRERNQRQIDRIGQPATRRRPTSDSLTPDQLISQTTDISKAAMPQADFEARLREFTESDGRTPRYTEEEVQMISASTYAARETRVAANAAAKAESDAVKRVADIDKARNQAVNLISRTFTRRNGEGRPRTLTQIIQQDFIDNPNRKIMNRAERIEALKEVLREMTDLDAQSIDIVANQSEAAFAEKLEQKRVKFAESFSKKMRGNKLTADLIQKAIRLEILDPSKDLMTSVASYSGWKGLSEQEMAKLASLQRRIDIKGANSREAITLTEQMARIIATSSGISPEFADTLNSFVRGMLYSGVGSLIIGAFTGWSIGTWRLLITQNLISLNDAVRRGDLGSLPAIIRSNSAAYAEGHIAGFREFLYSLQTGSTAQEQIRSGQETPVGGVTIDALTRNYDDALKSLARTLRQIEQRGAGSVLGNRADAIQFLKDITKVVTSAPRFTFTALTAIDSGASKIMTTAEGRIESERMARQIGLTTQDLLQIRGLAKEKADAYILKKQAELGENADLSWEEANLWAIEAADQFSGEIFQAMTQEGVENLGTLKDEILADFQSKIGVGKTSTKTTIGKTTNYVSQLANAIPGGALLFPAVRTVGNLTDDFMWNMPVVGIIRAQRYKRWTPEKQREYFPNIKSHRVFKLRELSAYASTGATAIVYALLKANEELPDDEKWFWHTGFYPVGDSIGAERLQLNDWEENMLIVGPLRLHMGRGAAQSLMFPSLVAKMLLDGDEEGNAVGWAGLLGPGYDQVSGIVNTLYREGFTGDSDLEPDATMAARVFDTAGRVVEGEGLLGRQLHMTIPAIAKSYRRTQPEIDRRRSDAAFEMLNPLWVVEGDDGVVTMRNRLGQKLESESNPMRWVRTLGFPVYYGVNEKKDPAGHRVMTLLIERGYKGGGQSVKEVQNQFAKNKFTYTPKKGADFEEFRGRYIIDRVTDRVANLPDEKFSEAIKQISDDATRATVREFRRREFQSRTSSENNKGKE